MKKLIPEARKNLAVLLSLNLSLLFISLLYALAFAKNPEAFDCVIKRAFGFYCPACGGSRSLAALLRLDFIDSFILYPPLLISALVILSCDIRLFLSVIKNTDKYTKNYKYYPFIIIPVSIILNFIIRNIFLFSGVDYIGDILLAYNFSLL